MKSAPTDELFVENHFHARAVAMARNHGAPDPERHPLGPHVDDSDWSINIAHGRDNMIGHSGPCVLTILIRQSTSRTVGTW